MAKPGCAEFKEEFKTEYKERNRIRWIKGGKRKDIRNIKYSNNQLMINQDDTLNICKKLKTNRRDRNWKWKRISKRQNKQKRIRKRKECQEERHGC